MSQNENPYSSIKRSRETIGGYNSSIPQPSSVRRSNSQSGSSNNHGGMPPPRMSMVPQPRSNSSTGMRPSMAGGGLDTNIPVSAMKSARKSYAPGAFPMASSSASSSQQQAPPSSTRRSSAYSRPSGGAQFSTGTSFFQAPIVTAGVIKDPRPLRDRNFQAKMAQEILEYLAITNFEMQTRHQISANFLKSPTQKDFTIAFQYLYHQIDPHYAFQKPVEPEVLPILKTLRYPYIAGISKSSISAVGGANTWPTFLAVLHWLLELVKTLDRFETAEYEALIEEDTGVDVANDRIIFEFLAKSYQAWLVENDDHEGFYQEMVEAFNERVGSYLADAEEIEAHNEQLRLQLKELDPRNEEGKTPLQVLEGTKQTLEKDKEKFMAYINDIEARIQRTASANARLRDKLADMDRELQGLYDEKQSLQKAVDKQGLTPADIDRMNTERDKLDKSLGQTSARIDDLRVRVAEREKEAATKLELLERAVSRYNTLAYQIGVTPATATNAGGKDYELVLFPHKAGGSMPMNVDPDQDAMQVIEDTRLLYDSGSGYLPAQLVNRDLRHEVKPSLEKLRKEIAERIHKTEDEALKQGEFIERIGEALVDLKEEVDGLKAKVHAAQTELEGIKETTTAESNASNAEIEKLERELQTLRIGLNNGVLSLDQRLQSVQIEWDQLQHSANNLRQELHSEVEKSLNEIIKFKIHIQEGLGEYEQRLEDEVKNATRVAED
ncbi:HEC/Ndc80p family-domain-containing protein [Peziza echinospora]|nr:HEC/Ndc80p family-domain-containing protein [Peziza echinospora]